MDSRSRYITTPEDAEQFAASQMREMGFPDAGVTGLGADGASTSLPGVQSLK